MGGRQRFFNAGFGGAYRLIGKPLQPQHAPVPHVRHYPQFRPETNDIPIGNDLPTWLAGRITEQSLLQMPTRTGLHAVAEYVVRRFVRGSGHIEPWNAIDRLSGD